MSTSHVCARCFAELGAVCCQTAPGEKLATLTFADIDRIQAATGLLRARFAEVEELDPAERLAYETFRPLYRGLFVGGLRLGLRARKGACVFWEQERGCTLPVEARPVACRTYPFDFDLAGEITLLDAPHCLALQIATGPQSLLRSFGTSRRALLRLRRQALADAADHIARRQRGER